MKFYGMSSVEAQEKYRGGVKDYSAAEGRCAEVPYKGPVAAVLHQLAGGLRAAMGYVGAKTLAEFRQKARFVRVTAAGVHESHVHDVTVTRESPNYPSRG